MILHSNFNISHELITKLAEKSNHYYTLLEAHNKNTEDMKKDHNVSNRNDLTLKLFIYYNKKITFLKLNYNLFSNFDCSRI